METPEQQPDERATDDAPDAGGETPTPATLPSDTEGGGDARDGDDEQDDEQQPDSE
jgi:hypothetical protein